MEDKILKKFDDMSREELINVIQELEYQKQRDRDYFRNFEERIIGANSEIEFLRQVILNLTKK